MFPSQWIANSANSLATDYFSFRRATRGRPNSMPGPDTLPSGAWTAAGSLGIRCLMGCDGHLRSGNQAPAYIRFNVSSMAFLVKGEAASDSVAVFRDPMDTRPLCMKNTFNKLIVSANCNALNTEFTKITYETQNGFVGGRNCLKNLVDIDASGRIYSNAYEGKNSQRSHTKSWPQS